MALKTRMAMTNAMSAPVLIANHLDSATPANGLFVDRDRGDSFVDCCMALPNRKTAPSTRKTTAAVPPSTIKTSLL